MKYYFPIHSVQIFFVNIFLHLTSIIVSLSLVLSTWYLSFSYFTHDSNCETVAYILNVTQAHRSWALLILGVCNINLFSMISFLHLSIFHKYEDHNNWLVLLNSTNRDFMKNAVSAESSGWWGNTKWKGWWLLLR